MIDRLTEARERVMDALDAWYEATKLQQYNSEDEDLFDAYAELKRALGDPSVLSLPQVPEGAVALIGATTGWRYEPYGDGWVCEEYSGRLGYVLQREGSVTAVMREPRTWPKLDSAPDDLPDFRGVSGTVYTRTGKVSSYRAFVPKWNVGDPQELICSATLSHWQEIDGPLTEVFDDPGGTP